MRNLLLCTFLLAVTFTAQSVARSEGQPQGQVEASGPAASTRSTGTATDAMSSAASAPTGSSASGEASSNDGAAAQKATADEAAVRAERRRRFEAAKAQLENSAGAASEGDEESAAGKGSRAALSISPNYASMLTGEGRRFSLMNTVGRHVEDEAEWTSTNPSVVEVTGAATVVTHAEGTAVIRARVGMDESEATVKVYPGTSLPMGTHIWEAPLGGSGPGRIIPAVPH